MGTWPAYIPPARQGPYRNVGAYLPLTHAIALRAHAAKSGKRINAILCDLVSEYLKVNDLLNIHSQPPAASLVALPGTQRAREATGKAEPDRVLQALDEAREASPGVARRD